MREVSISPNGSFIASIISVNQSNDTSSYELHVWQLRKSGWYQLEAVSLSSTLRDGDAKAGPLLGWTDDNTLVLLVPVVIPASANESVMGLHQLGTSNQGFLLSISPWGENTGQILTSPC